MRIDKFTRNFLVFGFLMCSPLYLSSYGWALSVRQFDHGDHAHRARTLSESQILCRAALTRAPHHFVDSSLIKFPLALQSKSDNYTDLNEWLTPVVANAKELRNYVEANPKWRKDWPIESLFDAKAAVQYLRGKFVLGSFLDFQGLFYDFRIPLRNAPTLNFPAGRYEFNQFGGMVVEADLVKEIGEYSTVNLKIMTPDDKLIQVELSRMDLFELYVHNPIKTNASELRPLHLPKGDYELSNKLSVWPTQISLHGKNREFRATKTQENLYQLKANLSKALIPFSDMPTDNTAVENLTYLSEHLGEFIALSHVRQLNAGKASELVQSEYLSSLYLGRLLFVRDLPNIGYVEIYVLTADGIKYVPLKLNEVQKHLVLIEQENRFFQENGIWMQPISSSTRDHLLSQN